MRRFNVALAGLVASGLVLLAACQAGDRESDGNGSGNGDGNGNGTGVGPNSHTSQNGSSGTGNPTTTTTTGAPLDGGGSSSGNPPGPGPGPGPGLPGNIPSAGCGHAAAGTGYVAGKTLSTDNGNRLYDLYVPPGADANTPLPLLFVFHGDTGNSIRPGFPIEAESAGGAIIVYPHGTPAWDLSAAADNQDYPFAVKLHDELAGKYCVDDHRVFAFGYSNGGFFAEMMACFGPKLFNAVVSNSGGLYVPDGEEGASYDDNGHVVCPNGARSMMIIHGTKDTTVSYTSDGIYARDSWRAANGCGTATTAFDPSPCVNYDNCTKAPVAFCPFNGGHALSSIAAPAAWNFLKTL